MTLLLNTQVQVTRDDLEMILLRQKDDDYAETELLLKTRQDMPVDEDLINTRWCEIVPRSWKVYCQGNHTHLLAQSWAIGCLNKQSDQHVILLPWRIYSTTQRLSDNKYTNRSGYWTGGHGEGRYFDPVQISHSIYNRDIVMGRSCTEGDQDLNRQNISSNSNGAYWK